VRMIETQIIDKEDRDMILVSPSSTFVLQSSSVFGPSPDEVNNLGNTTCENGLRDERGRAGTAQQNRETLQSMLGSGTEEGNGESKRRTGSVPCTKYVPRTVCLALNK